MKQLLTILIFAATIQTAQSAKQPSHGYPISPVPFTSVKVTPGTFWGQRLEASRNVTEPLAYRIGVRETERRLPEIRAFLAAGGG